MARRAKTTLTEEMEISLAAEVGMDFETFRKFTAARQNAKDKLKIEKEKQDAIDAEAAKKKAEEDAAELLRIATILNVPLPNAKRFHVTELEVKKDNVVIGTKITNVKLYYSSSDFSKELKALIKSGDDRTPEDIALQVEEAKKSLLMDLVKISM